MNKSAYDISKIPSTFIPLKYKKIFKLDKYFIIIILRFSASEVFGAKFENG